MILPHEYLVKAHREGRQEAATRTQLACRARAAIQYQNPVLDRDARPRRRSSAVVGNMR